MDTAIPIPKTAENKVQETLHFRYLKFLVNCSNYITIRLSDPTLGVEVGIRGKLVEVELEVEVEVVSPRCNPQNLNTSGQIITTSAEVTLNGGLIRELPQNPLNSGLGIILVWPDT